MTTVLDADDPYIRAASPLRLLMHDAELLVMQFDRNLDDIRLQLTIDERRAWLDEAEAVLRALDDHSISAECLMTADRRHGLQTLAQRRQWAKEARHVLHASAAAIRAGAPSSSSYADVAAWNVMMRAGTRLVTFKIAGHAARSWPKVNPPDPGADRHR